MDKETLRMQMLSGIITEGEYKAKLEESKDLLLLWKQRYNIPLTYNADIWDITPRALRGEAGVFTHNSVRTDKVDVYPHPKLIQMLKSL